MGCIYFNAQEEYFSLEVEFFDVLKTSPMLFPYQNGKNRQQISTFNSITLNFQFYT